MNLVIRDGYQATHRGAVYDASPDGDTFRLYTTEPADGFERVNDRRYRKVVAAGEVEDFCYVRTMCMWRSEPFLVLAEHDGWLRVEYTGGKAPIAKQLGLEEFDFGVYQGWAPASDVTDIREYRV